MSTCKICTTEYTPGGYHEHKLTGRHQIALRDDRYRPVPSRIIPLRARIVLDQASSGVLTLEEIGQSLDPPISRQRVDQIIRRYGGSKVRKEPKGRPREERICAGCGLKYYDRHLHVREVPHFEPLNPEAVQLWREAQATGLKATAKAHGMKIGTLSRRFLDQGLPGKYVDRSHVQRMAARDTEILAKWRSGASVKELAREYSTTTSTIHRAIKMSWRKELLADLL